MRSIKDIINQTSADYIQDKDVIIEMLKDAFCEEMLAWYQYIVITPFLVGKERVAIQNDYLENAKDELEDHGYWLLERINQLGGTFAGIESPEDWNRVATHKYIMPNLTDTKTSVLQMIEAEKGAIETYERIIEFVKDKDHVTYKKLIDILADEQEHLQEMQDFYADICA